MFRSDDAKCSFLKTDLSVIGRTIEWENGSSSIQISPVSIGGLGASKTISTTVAGEGSLTSGLENYVGLRGSIIIYDNNYFIQDFLQYFSQLKINVFSGQTRVLKNDYFCSVSGNMNLSYKIVNYSAPDVLGLVEINETNGEMLHDANFETTLFGRFFQIEIRQSLDQVITTIDVDVGKLVFISELVLLAINAFFILFVGILGGGLILSNYGSKYSYSWFWIMTNQLQILMILVMTGSLMHPQVVYFIVDGISQFLVFGNLILLVFPGARTYIKKGESFLKDSDLSFTTSFWENEILRE